MKVRLAVLGAIAVLGFCVQPAKAAEASPPAFEIERSAVHTIESPAAKRRYGIFVKTPPGYDDPANAGRRYPVIYMTDGPYTFQVASGISRLLFSQKKMEEFILVGIGYAEGESGTASRNRDLTPWTNPNNPGIGGAAAFLKFIRTDAMPELERLYRIDPARRTLAGQSYGGLFGLWVALTEPELFSSYILTSPSIWYARKALLELEARYAAKNKDMRAAIYFAIGSFETVNPASDDPRYLATNDMVGDQQEMAKRLQSRNYPGLRVRSDVIEGTVHETTFPVGLIHALHWLFPYLGK